MWSQYNRWIRHRQQYIRHVPTVTNLCMVQTDGTVRNVIKLLRYALYGEIHISTYHIHIPYISHKYLIHSRYLIFMHFLYWGFGRWHFVIGVLSRDRHIHTTYISHTHHINISGVSHLYFCWLFVTCQAVFGFVLNQSQTGLCSARLLVCVAGLQVSLESLNFFRYQSTHLHVWLSSM